MKAQNLNDQVTPQETAEILRLAQQCLELDGDFVELGCYRGDTSVLLGKLLADTSVKSSKSPSSCGKPVENFHKPANNLCISHKSQCKTCVENPKSCAENVEKSHQSVQNPVEKLPKPVQNLVENPAEKSVEKRLWIYDSFAGLPEKTTEDNSGAGRNFQKGELSVTKREVVDKIRKHGLHNIIIKKAWFDDLEDEDLPESIAFAFLDGDLYSSIKTSLKLVVPRLVPQGTIIVHDYNNPELPGSSRAVDEFLRSHSNFRLQIRYSLAILHKEC